MSARLVFVLLVALAIFASAQAESCYISTNGSLDGQQGVKNEVMEIGQSSITFNLNSKSINPCGNYGNTNGVEAKVCVPDGTASINFGDSTVVVRRSSSASTASVVLRFYCR